MQGTRATIVLVGILLVFIGMAKADATLDPPSVTFDYTGVSDLRDHCCDGRNMYLHVGSPAHTARIDGIL